MEKILRISLKLNFTPNALGCYGLNRYEQTTSIGVSFYCEDLSRSAQASK